MTFYKLKKDADSDKRGRGRGIVFKNNKLLQVFREWAMALLSPPPHDDHHGDHWRHHHGEVNGRGHAGHHDDNGPSPPPPHSKLSFLLFDFTFGQKSSTAEQTHWLLLKSNEYRPGRGLG